MRLRLAPQDHASSLVAYLAEHQYPHEWPVDLLKDCCLMFRLEEGGAVVGWIWFNWLEGVDHVLDMHLCIDRKFRGRWLYSRVPGELETVVRVLGAKQVMARLDDRALHLVLQKFGFEDFGPFSLKHIQEEPDGVETS